MHHLIRKLFRAPATALAVALAVGTATPTLAQDKEITVLIWGVTWKSAIAEMSEKFTKETGIKVNYATQASSGEGLVKLQTMRDKPTVDVWFTTASVADRAAGDDRLLAPLPKASMPNLSMLPPGLVADKYAAVYSYPLSIIYRTDKVDAPITSWADLWEPRFARKLAVPAMDMFQGRTLMIASVAGGDAKNIDKGFEMLAKLKPNVAVFYGSDAQARQALAQGEVSVLVAPPSQAKRMTDAGIPVKVVSPKGTPMNADVMTIVGSGKEAMAAQYINFMLGKAANEAIAAGVNMAAVNRESKQPEALLAAIPKPDDALILDEAVINKNIAAWLQRFNRDIVR
jgi:putative spermidine/putrescine transport system substrate-binding protein